MQNIDEKIAEEFQKFLDSASYEEFKKKNSSLIPMDWVYIMWLRYYVDTYDEWFQNCSPSTKESMKKLKRAFGMSENGLL